MNNKCCKKITFCLAALAVLITAYALLVFYDNTKPALQSTATPSSRTAPNAATPSASHAATAPANPEQSTGAITAESRATAAGTLGQPISEKNIQAGVHYKRLNEKIRSKPSVRQLTTSNPNKPQVLIFFSYGCAVCSKLNKPFDGWASKQDPNKIIINKFPVSFNRGWESLAQAYFAVQALGKADTLDEVIFTGIHEKNMPLWVESNLQELVAKQGVDKEAFKQAYSAFSVKTQAKNANDLSIAFELAAIPNIVINGQGATFVTNLSMTKTPEFLFAVVEHLIQKAEKNNGGE